MAVEKRGKSFKNDRYGRKKIKGCARGLLFEVRFRRFFLLLFCNGLVRVMIRKMF